MDFYEMSFSEFTIAVDGYTEVLEEETERFGILLYYLIDTGFKSWKKPPNIRSFIDGLSGKVVQTNDLTELRERFEKERLKCQNSK